MVSYPRTEARYPGGKSHWQLPEVLSVQARYARYAEPKLRYVGTQMMEWREAVEFLVRTAGEFPARALSPALFVGEKPIANYDVVGPNQRQVPVSETVKSNTAVPVGGRWFDVETRGRCLGPRRLRGATGGLARVVRVQRSRSALVVVGEVVRFAVSKVVQEVSRKSA